MTKSSKSRKGPSSLVQQRTRIPIEIVLPEVMTSDDSCVGRLIDVLSLAPGIDSSHLLEAREGAASELCIHYDPTLTSVVKVRELAELAGGQLHQRYGHILLSTKPMHAGRASAMEARLTRIPGVLESVVSPNGTIRVEFDRELTSEKLVHRALGKWPPTSHDPGGGVRLNPATATTNDAHLDHDHSDHEEQGHAESGHTHGGIFGKNTELVFAGLSGLFLLAGWLGEAFFDLPNGWTLILFIGAYFFGGFYSLKEMVEKIRSRKFEIDFLMLVAASGAASIGAWSEGALLLFLFSVGHSLEGYAMGRAKRAIEALADLSPPTATVRRGAVESEVPVEDLVVRDIVIVKPDERLAADGFVVAGESSVDQAPITGESLPADKVPTSNIAAAAADPESVSAEHRVFAGTINQAGALEIQVTKIAAENTLARLVTMVNEAETRISPTQRFTKKFERYFVPAVVGGVVLLLFSPLVLDESFTAAFYRAMAVLVAASPCALAIATPSAVLSGIARAARGGILVKGGAPLENLGKLDSIAFDKTGTLTEGKPVVTDVRPAEGASEADLLRTAVAVESLSKHPLAQAVVRDGKSRLTEIGSGNESIPQATDLRSITGRGIQALVEGNQVYIGKDDLFTEIEGSALPEAIRSTVTSLEAAGRTTMIIRRGDHFLGVLGLMDTPRDAAKRTISALRRLGVKHMIMISGDNQTVANAVAKEVGLDEARGDLMPEDKVEEIRRLASATGVAMVGDGVNDAPAMAAANVGIAMGAAGSDVALETADVALMADNLDHLPLAIGLSRATSRIIRQNLWMSLGMVAFLVPATVLGLGIGPAVMLHEGSTLVVVFNALRLLAYSN